MSPAQNSSKSQPDHLPDGPLEASTDSGLFSGISENKPAPEEYEASQMQAEATRLMTAVHGGDLEAFNQLTSCVRGRAFRVAQSLVGSREDAMEICQETFMKVFKARSSYRPSEPFLPWFHRILRNTCYSFLRKRGRYRAV